MFDADWEKHGLLDKVVRDAAQWVEGRKVAGPDARGHPPAGPHAGDLLRGRVHAPGAGVRHAAHHRHVRPPRQAARVQRLAQRPRPVDAQGRGRQALRPRRRRRRLRGLRGGQRASRRSKAQGVAHPRIVGLIESCEESGSSDLPVYLDALKERLGDVTLVVCLDSRRRQLRPAVAHHQPARQRHRHAEGRDPHRRHPLRRRQRPRAVELPHPAPRARSPGGLAAPAACCPRASTARSRPTASSRCKAAAAILGDEVWKRMPWACGADGGPTLPTTTDPAEALLNRTWRPTLSVTGVDGFPELQQRRQRAAPVQRVQAEPAPAAAGRRQRGRGAAEDAARGQRAVQRQGHLPARRPHGRLRRHRLERAVARPVDGERARTPPARRTSARRWATSARAARSR